MNDILKMRLSERVRRKKRFTLTGEKLECGDDAKQTMSYVARIFGRIRDLPIGGVLFFYVAGNEVLQDLHQVLEEVNIHKMRVFRDTLQGGREKWCWDGIL